MRRLLLALTLALAAPACGDNLRPDPAAEVTMDRAATDLRAHLTAWYADHGADVAAAGGNDLATAQAAVDPAAFAEVVDPTEDPRGHDLDAASVLAHPDVVFPGSDVVWFVAYDRATGDLIEAYDFN